MGFFKDFKRDFAQAVNELMPDKDELANEYDDEDMVNTFDEEDNMDIAPEDMLEDLDDFTIDNTYADPISVSSFQEDMEPQEEMVSEPEDEFDNIPAAEVISETNDVAIEDFGEQNMADSIVVDMSDIADMVDDTIMADEPVVADESVMDDEPAIADESVMDEELAIDEGSDTDEVDDELASLDELDEENMQENLEDALLVEPEEAPPESPMDEFKDVDLDKAVEAAILKHDEDNQTVEAEQNEDDYEEEDMMDIAAKMDTEMREKEQDPSSVLSDDTAYITKGTTIKGNIETDGGVDIIGTVEGNVTCGGKLIVGGLIKGNVDAGEIYANAAKIEGEITSAGSVKIGVGSVVVGNVNATSAVVAGAVNGDIDVHGPVIVDSTAVIMGNIKSRSVQINNGAVIEGFCSQCYSEIDVKSFFE